MARKQVATAIALSLAATMLSSPALAKTLNFNSQVLENTVSGQVEKWFAEEITRRSDGDLTVRVFFGEGLGKASESLSLMADGAIDMASMSAGYYPAELPLTAAPNSIPMALDDVAQASELMSRILDEVPEVREEHEQNGIRALFFHHLNPYYLLSTEPVEELSDLEGKRMRTWGSEMPQLATAAGAIPVTLGMGELYESLSRGAVNVVPLSFDYIRDYRLYEVAENISLVPAFVGPTGGVWISEMTWQSLSEEEQELILEVTEEALEKDFEMVTAAADEARAYLEQQGVSVEEFPEEEEARWREANPDFFADFITRMEGQGKGDAARKMVEIYKEVRADDN
ncbi:MAG TPA: TRAP transporter substrate-binding protein DctP [Kiloniellales bacterium]|nr:TRAP transporter substrate-binding protein DctP [Kiloniellales bacterium]